MEIFDKEFEKNYENAELLNNILGVSVEGSQYLTFSIGEEEYALSILKVKEIIGMKKITQIPNLPSYVKGVINLRGNIIHIIDIRERFKMEVKTYDKFTVIIIIETHEKTMGIIVDQVQDVVNIEKNNIQNIIDFEGNIDSEYIDGMAKVGEKLVVVLDVEKLINGK